MAYNRPKNSNRVFARNSDGITPNDNLTSGVDDRTQFFGSSRGSVKVNIITNNTPAAFDSAQDAWHAETFQSFAVPTIIDRDNSFSGNNLMRNFRNDQYINITSDSGARYKDTMWTYGAGIKIFSDGTAPASKIDFVDSDYFRGGADHSTLMIQGLAEQDSIATNLASAPDSDFLNYQEDSFYSPPRSIINNEYSLFTNLMSMNAYGFYGDSIDKNTITAFEGGVPFEYDSTPILTSGGGGDGGDGGGATADPEAWS
jgi:hypothetical protein